MLSVNSGHWFWFWFRFLIINRTAYYSRTIVFTHATRVLAVVLCLSVCHKSVLKRLNQSSWFWRGSFFPHILYCTHTHTHGPWFGPTLVGRYQKKHSPTHTYPDHRTSFINFLHLLWFVACSLFVETCFRLSLTKVDAPSVTLINWTFVGQLSWQYLQADLRRASVDRCT